MIRLSGITVQYSDTTPFQDADFEFEPGATAVMGPSGSGKTTLLRLIAGTQRPDSGAVTINGEPVQNASWNSTGDPRVSLIHQDYRLVPFLTVGQNISLAAELRGMDISKNEVVEALEMVGLPPVLADRLPRTASGGEQQRVAIARALVAKSSVLLADEPTGALDAQNSRVITRILTSVAHEHGLCVVVATHDQAVADELDRVLRLHGSAYASAGG